MPIGNLNPRNIVTITTMNNKIANVDVFFPLAERTRTISIKPIAANPNRNFMPYNMP